MPAVDELAALVARLEAAVTKLEAGGGSGSAESLSASVSAYDELLASLYKPFSGLSKKIGGDVATIGAMLDKAFAAQRDFLVMSSNSKKPGDQQLQLLLKPTSDIIAEIQSFREKSRRSEFFNHLSAISESIPALGWVTVAPTPAPFVKEMNDAGQFYTNRVLKDWKEKDKTHVDWVKGWVATLTELQAYVKKYYTTGLTWNPAGGEASVRAPAAGGAPPPPPPGGPPPPPPVGGLDLSAAAPAPDPAKNARADLLAALNKGEGVTAGLKKVSKDQMTHKNPNLRAGNVVKHVDKKETPTKSYGKPVAADKPPRMEMDGKKWNVEFFKDRQDLQINEIEVNQSVYVYKCQGSTIKVNGKCNNIIIDGCKKTAIVFESVVSSVEFINCQSVQMQVLGKVPTISVDKTDGCQMYLNQASVGAEIMTAKSSEMNIMIPSGDEFVEQPVPEQFKTVISGGKLVTTATESV